VKNLLTLGHRRREKLPHVSSICIGALSGL
jgi:hypothetical protein